MMPVSRPMAMAATVPVPVIPRATTPSRRCSSPVRGSTRADLTGCSLSLSTMLYHLPFSPRAMSLIACGAASMPKSMDCPSMAGPAAAEPVYSSPL